MPRLSEPATGTGHATTPADAGHMMSGVEAPWWIAGGWALDLFLGSQTRPHKDLDVGIRREDSRQIIATLRDWEFFEAHAGALFRIESGGEPRKQVNSLWGRRVGEPHWTLELLLDRSAREEWIFRRDPSIRRPLASALRGTADGTRYLAPEIQLLYKARDLRAEDRADFQHTAPRLDRSATDWLRGCLERLYPRHPWLAELPL
jgi:Aminoglycoside-2''-adenylyltransferase